MWTRKVLAFFSTALSGGSMVQELGESDDLSVEADLKEPAYCNQYVPD